MMRIKIPIGGYKIDAVEDMKFLLERLGVPYEIVFEEKMGYPPRHHVILELDWQHSKRLLSMRHVIDDIRNWYKYAETEEERKRHEDRA